MSDHKIKNKESLLSHGDAGAKAQVLELIEKLKEDFDTSLLLITHDLGVVAELCQKVAIIYAGSIVEYGTLEEVFNHTKHPYTPRACSARSQVWTRMSTD